MAEKKKGAAQPAAKGPTDGPRPHWEASPRKRKNAWKSRAGRFAIFAFILATTLAGWACADVAGAQDAVSRLSEGGRALWKMFSAGVCAGLAWHVARRF